MRKDGQERSTLKRRQFSVSFRVVKAVSRREACRAGITGWMEGRHDKREGRRERVMENPSLLRPTVAASLPSITAVHQGR